MTTVYDIPASFLIARVAEELKGLDGTTPPDWSKFVKTGVHRETAPQDPEWWHTRLAAVLRKIYINGPVGVQRLAGEFGGPKNRGVKPFRAAKGSRSILRTACKQLEAAELVESVKDDSDRPLGRRITAKGRSFLDGIAHQARGDVEEQFPDLAGY